MTGITVVCNSRIHLLPANILGFFGRNNKNSRHERILPGLLRNW
jgi:hypothetical protein